MIKKVIKVAIVMTKTTAAPIPTDEEILLDTPKKGQIPKVWAKTILLTNIVLMIRRIYSMTFVF